MNGASTQWFKTAKTQFPEMIDPSKSSIGYRPSPAGGDDARFYEDPVEPAMLSYAELGFIPTGAPWETLTLFNDPARFKDSDRDHADWRLLDYVDVGTPPRHLNAADPPQREVYGQVNVNTTNRNALLAVSTVGRDLSSPESAVDALLASLKAPFLSPADVFSEPNFRGEATDDAGREKFVAKVYPALTAHSQKFTVYSAGEAWDIGAKNTPAHVTLAADIELRVQQLAAGSLHAKPTILRIYHP